MSNAARDYVRKYPTPLRVLIVAAHYPPVNSVAATRPAQWARLLARHGHTVSVLTTEVRAETLQGCDLDVPAGEVIRIAIPFQRLIGRFDHAGQEPRGIDATRSSGKPALLARFLHWMRRVRGAFSSARMPDHHDLWTIAALWRIRNRFWDVVISTHGPYACHTIGYCLRRSGRAKRWISDYRDLWADNHIYPGIFPFTMIESWLEKLFCSSADAITTVSEGLASRLAQSHHRSVEVIHNTVDLDTFRRLDTAPAFSQDGLIRFVYTGTVYPTGQSPQLLFEALARVRDEAPTEFSCIRLIFAGKAQANIRNLALRYGMAGIMEQPGQVSREFALRMQRDADVLIFLSFCSPGYPGILTSKLFEYLASGARILSIGSGRDDSIAQLLDQSERGIDPGPDVASIAVEIVRLIRDASSDAKYVLTTTRTTIDFEQSGNVLHRLLYEDRGGAYEPGTGVFL